MPIEVTSIGIKGPKGDAGQSGNPTIFASAVPIKYISPATTFTGVTVSDNGSGKVLLTGAGAHGMLAADAIGASINVISGTGWTAGSLHKIIGLDTDVTGNKITLDTAFASQGSPSITLGNTSFRLVFLGGIPALSAKGIIKLDITVTVKNNSNSKKIQVRYMSATMAESPDLVGVATHRMLAVIQNQDVQNSQIGMALGTPGGVGSSINPLTSNNADTSVITTIGINVVPYPAEPITIERYFIEVLP